MVLVTGARGFLGTYCVPLLAESGFDVLAASSTAGGPTLPGVRWRQCNLLERTETVALLREERPSHLLHLAWITQPGVFWSSARNLEWLSAGTRLFDAFYELGGERAVGLGTCAEYEISAAPCLEDVTPITPATVYAKAKAAMHGALQAAAEGRGSYAWVRLFFPYGPGEADDRFIPSVIRGLLRGQPVLCTHGQQVRDFIFVSDAAAACAALLESPQSGAYNVASGVGVSLRWIAEIITRHLGSAELLRFGARETPPFDPESIVGDTAKIARDIGWRPKVGLEDGLLQSITAHKRAMRPPVTSASGTIK
jgi:nucleoside-diphosphate-sugar epimerase